MDSRRFDYGDLPELNRWHRAHGRGDIPFSALSSSGFIVPGVACGFLYATDSDMAVLEGWTTNPEVPWRTRVKALSLLKEQAIEYARVCGYKRIVAFATPSVSKWLCHRHGFEAVGTSITCAREL